ncbi:MAG: YwaF family protein [Coriobacteriia bacterium]|nr:YwaF family protein [Coriobacteriia bacterium]
MVVTDIKLLMFNVAMVVIALLGGLLVRARTTRFKLNVIRTLAIAIMLLDLSIIPYRVFTNYGFMLNADLSTDLPIYFCDIIMVIQLVAFCGPKVVRFLKPFAIWGAFLGGVFVLVDPNFYSPSSFFFGFVQFRSILTHSLLLGLFTFAVSSRFFTPYLKHIFNILVCGAALLIYAAVINAIFAHSVIAHENPGWQLNALYMQRSPVPIAAARGPLIATFMLVVLFIINFIIELARKKSPTSVFSYYRHHAGGGHGGGSGHPGGHHGGHGGGSGFLRKSLDYFILDPQGLKAVQEPQGEKTGSPA